MSATVAASRLDALRDPAYHRYAMFGRVDAALARQLGRPLLPSERQGELRGPQAEVVRRIERAVASRTGETITVLMARQAGKNEVAAFVQARALNIFSGIPSSTWVRCAPTHKPQIVNSKLRLRKILEVDPFVRDRWRPVEGYIYQVGHAQVQFLSAGPTANVVGATASLCLDVDEAHKIDQGKFEEDFGPFTASTDAPTVMWGVAADRLDLLHEYRERNEGTDRLFVLPAEVWCELNPSYAEHYTKRRAALGASHPVILTQYDLVPVDAVGGYLDAFQRAALFSGDHPRLEGPRPGMHYGAVLDFGGESELADATTLSVESDEPQRDATFGLIFEWDPNEASDPYPMVRWVSALRWVGRQHMAAVDDLSQWLRHWQVRIGASDARGVGEAVAMALQRRFPGVKAYKATVPTVSEDCYDYLARLNTGRVRMWRADPETDPEFAELAAQARHTQREITGHENMRLAKPTGRGTSALHIDGMKCQTYLGRALGLRTSADAVVDYYARQAERVRAEREAEQEGAA